MVVGAAESGRDASMRTLGPEPCSGEGAGGRRGGESGNGDGL